MQYTNIVLGIPHAAGKPSDIKWTDNPEVAKAVDRWTDWFTDELFFVKHDGISSVRGNISRFDCDVERLEHEPDRICRFLSLCDDDSVRAVTASRWNRRLSQWFKYRYELMLAASQGDRPIILDCHSFPEDLAEDVDIDLGFNDDSSRPPDAVIAAVADIFKKAGYSVGLNRPYANAIAPLGYQGHSLMIEINKRCYMDETKRRKHKGFAHCRECLEKVYAELLGARRSAHPAERTGCLHKTGKTHGKSKPALSNQTAFPL